MTITTNTDSDIENIGLDATQTSEHDQGVSSIPEQTEAPEDTSGNAEAAKYRRRLRETEAERDALTSRLEAMQYAEALRLAADLAEPGDLFTIGGVTVADLLDEAGDIDTGKVAEAVTALLEKRPGLHKDARRPVQQLYPNFGQSAQGYRGGGGSGVSWQDALRGR